MVHLKPPVTEILIDQARAEAELRVAEIDAEEASPGPALEPDADDNVAAPVKPSSPDRP